nr:hypothetical protein [Tanacetum cinerariifolium]
MRTNQFAGAVYAILGIVHRYMDQRMNEAEVLTQSSNLSNTSYAVAADLSEMELKKILIEKMEGNKSIHRSNEQRNLYKALVEAYESDKIILDTYRDTVTLKRLRDDDANKDKKPSAGPDRGSKRRREGKEPESASAPHETATRSAGRSTQGSQSQQTSASESAAAEEPMQTTFKMEEPSHPEFETGADDQPIVESSQHPECIVIQRRVEDLQLGIESYQKKLNLTKPDTYRSDLKHKEAYIAYSNPRGFIYQNKDKKIRLMRIDELHKFSDGTLTDVCTALDDRLKGIRMQYLPQSIWRKSNKDRAVAMIQAIDKRLKTRRIIRSLERFVGGRLYEETSGCYKGPYDLSYAVPIFQKIKLVQFFLVNVYIILVDYLIILTKARNLVKKILLKLNLRDHRSILTDLQVTLTKPGRMTKPYSSHRFIANCFNAGNLKMEVKVPGSSCLTDS